MGCGASTQTSAIEPGQPNKLTQVVTAKRIIDDGSRNVENFKNFQTARNDENQKNCEKQVAEKVMRGIEEEPDEFKQMLKLKENLEKEQQQDEKRRERQELQMQRKAREIEERAREHESKMKMLKVEENRIKNMTESQKKEEMSHRDQMKKEEEKNAKKKRELDRVSKQIETKQRERDWMYNKLHGTREQYLKSLTFIDDAPCPFHWSSPEVEDHPKLRDYKEFLERSHITMVKERLDDQDPLYHEVRDLFLNSWTKDGVVSDEGIQIFIVMNPTVQQGYDELRAKLIKKQLSEQKFPIFKKAIEHCQGTKEPNLTSQVRENLGQILHPEINEFCLFHGTTKGVVETLCAQGLDPRVSADGNHGTGIYFADSATKSHNYTDRKKPGPNYMFVGRVLMGDMHVTQTLGGFRRPPCSLCGKERCIDHGDSLRNSVVYIPMKSEGEWLDFREFIVYERHMASLDFLVVYNVMRSA